MSRFSTPASVSPPAEETSPTGSSLGRAADRPQKNRSIGAIPTGAGEPPAGGESTESTGGGHSAGEVMTWPPADLRPVSPWAPLRSPLFRVFWLASLASNLGTWIHEVGAGWLMTTLDGTPEMVASVRTCMALPIVVLAIPAGVLADRLDKRRLLMATQGLLLAVTATLACLTALGRVTPGGLLLLTFVIGLGMVVHVPTWQASVPELVPRRQIPQAVGLGSISFNLARAVGPALGGLLIAGVGIWSAFAVNAMSFAMVLAVLIGWRRETTESSGGRSFFRSTLQGIRFAIRNPVMRHVMIGVMLFVLPASALWSLLPLFAKTRLGWGAQGFGVLVATIGLGAVLGAAVLPRLRRALGSDRLLGCSMPTFALGLGVLSVVPAGPWVLAATVLLGAGWMATLTTLNATAQITLPQRLRARGMGCYLTMMAGSMAAGSFLWGQVAGQWGLSAAQMIAAVALVATSGLRRAFPLRTSLDH